MPRFTFQESLPETVFTKPKTVRVGADRRDADSWDDVGAAIVVEVLSDPRYQQKAVDWAATEKKRLARAKGVKSPENMLCRLRKMLEWCGVPLASVEVEYVEDESSTEPTTINPTTHRQMKGPFYSTFARTASSLPIAETLDALDSREGLFASLWARGLSYHGEDARPLSVADMRAARERWDGQHTEREVRLADCYARRKLFRARLSMGVGKGNGSRGGDLKCPFRSPKAMPVRMSHLTADKDCTSKPHRPSREPETKILERISVFGLKTPTLVKPAVVSGNGDDRKMDVKAVLERFFPDGIRPPSIIDRNKFARAWEGMFGAPMPSDMDLAAVLPFAGVTHGDKVLPAADAEGKTVADFAMEIVEAATGPFFYDCFFEAHAARLTKMGVQSGAMLRDYLRNDDGGRLVFGKSSFSVRGGPESVEDAVAAAFAEKPTWTRQELEDRFPYVPGDRVLAVLAQESKFVRIAEGEYRLASAILLDAEECEEAARRVEEGVREDGFFSMADCTFERSMERNGDIFLTALQTRFFDEWLSDRYSRHGQIVCEERARYDSMAEVRRFCRTRNEATLKQLLELEETCGLGGGNRTLATAYEEMVRVSSDRFLAPRLVAFDVAGTDATLDDLVPEWGVMPLTAVTSFVTFPPVDGWPWNGYMLESYLRRESKNFRYLSVSYASRTLSGAIVRNGAEFGTLVDALARAVVEAGVPPTEEDIGKYLLDAGYIQRRRGIQTQVANAVRRLLDRRNPTHKEAMA